MTVTLGNLIGLASVAILWGVTNPLLKKGAEGIESVKSSSVVDQFFKDAYFLITKLKYVVPFLINQCGSVIYILLLQNIDLSLTVVVVNALTFVVTCLTGVFLGEEKLHKNTYIGIILVLFGTILCCIGKF